MSQKRPFLRHLLFAIWAVWNKYEKGNLIIHIAKSQTIPNSFRLGSVRNFDDSGDSIWFTNTKKRDRIDRKAIARFGHGGFGRINIDGRDIELKLEKDYLPDKNFKVNRGGYQIWKGRNTTVRLDYIFTWLCPPKHETCEVYYYKGVLDINYKRKHRKVNIRGFGGS
jgi:hypothetical protein